VLDTNLMDNRQVEPMRENHGPLIIVSGPAHCGKTTLVTLLVSHLRDQGRQLAGILAEGQWRDQRRSGFTLVDLADGRRTLLAERIADCGPHAFPYAFHAEGLAAGYLALGPRRCAGADLVVVDEVGSLELRGAGWARNLGLLLRQCRSLQLWVVQAARVEAVCRKWQLSPVRVIDASQPQALDNLLITVEEWLPGADPPSHFRF
jgi:nucleoside-triphosphatase THEP1